MIIFTFRNWYFAMDFRWEKIAFNNLNIVIEIVQNGIDILKMKFKESVIKEDINTISKSIEIL